MRLLQLLTLDSCSARTRRYSGSTRVDGRMKRRQILGLMAGLPLLWGGSARAAGKEVDESGFVPVGGIDQWIAIQGRDSANPAVLYLHGGPGEAQSPFLEQFAPWRTDFTVVNWDQRGSGKTFGRNGASTPGMAPPEAALDRMCEDVREVAEYTCRRLGHKKVILVGQSWGSMLGLRAAKRWPHLFHAFVGTGFFVNWTESLRGQARSTREAAIAANDREALTALDSAEKLPETDMTRIIASNKYRWSSSDLAYLKIQQAFIGEPPLPERGDVADWVAGGGFSVPRLLSVIFGYDARKLGDDIPVPLFVIHGADDRVTPLSAAENYVGQVRAPAKKVVPIAGGHFACFTNPTAFVGALREHVRPFARG